MIGPEILFSSTTARKNPFSPAGPKPPENPLCEKAAWSRLMLTAAVSLSSEFAAAVTTKIKLATGVCLVPERHPLTLAKAVGTLDNFSGGRVILGVGSGWLPEETELYGVDFSDRWTYTRESVLAMKALWRDGEALNLPSRAFDTLVYLLRHRDRIVEKDELIKAVWQGAFVSDDSLVHCVSVLRRAVQARGISARSQHRILRVARSIADLADRDAVLVGDVAEALSLRWND